MSERIKLKIGAFSKLMQVTVKTLRHWEQEGLLLPHEVDEWTGYRYYLVDQMQKVNAIRRLQEMGFSLDEIRSLYEADSHTPDLRQLDAKIASCEEELRQLQLRRERLHRMVDAQKQIDRMETISMQTLPAIVVASYRGIINSYAELGNLCVHVIGPEMQRLGCKCPMPGYCFTIEHDKEYKPHDIDIEYCEQVEAMGVDSSIIRFKRLEEVPLALCVKHYGPYETIHASYVKAFAYIEEHGYRVAGPPRANYIDGIWNKEDPAQWLTLIQMPVEKV